MSKEELDEVLHIVRDSYVKFEWWYSPGEYLEKTKQYIWESIKTKFGESLPDSTGDSA